MAMGTSARSAPSMNSRCAPSLSAPRHGITHSQCVCFQLAAPGPRSLSLRAVSWRSGGKSRCSSNKGNNFDITRKDSCHPSGSKGRDGKRVLARGISRRGLVVGSASKTASVIGIAAGAMVMVAAAAAAARAGAGGGGGGPQKAVSATREGMQLFAKGDVKGSLEKFDEALKLDIRQLPYLWQRGLSLYYVERFEDGAKQFRDDVAVNPYDTEESIWCFLCEAQLYGVDEARRRFLVVGPDQRPIMAKIYDMFRYGGDPDEVLKAVDNKAGADFFYASLYTGLYHEAHKDQDAARDALVAAVQSPYGTRSNDYMAILARVHAECRGWKTVSSQ